MLNTWVMACVLLFVPPATYHPIEIKRVHDGDTISSADIQLGYGVVLKDQSIRLLGFDAWEISRTRKTVKITEEELRLGKLAKTDLLTVLAMGKVYIVQDGDGKNVYGRIDGWVMVYVKETDTLIDVAKWMRERGHQRKDLP